MSGAHAVALKSTEIPQANRLERVVALLSSAVEGRSDLTEVDARDHDYYTHAARTLGLLDADDAPTALGRVLARVQDSTTRRELLREAFAQSEVGRAWLQWAGAGRLEQLDPATAEDFLRQCSDLTDSTARRRALTLRRWWLDLGAGGQSLGSAVPSAPVSLSLEALAALDWDALREVLTHDQRELTLSRVELPARMASFGTQQGLHTLGQLLSFRKADLLERPNLGKKTVTDTRAAILSALRRLAELGEEAGDSTTVFAQYPDMFALWRAQLAELPSQQRLILTHRFGWHGEPMTLEELGALLGVTRERVRQLERAAIERLCLHDDWIRFVEARLCEKLHDGAVSLSELGAHPWFQGIEGRARELRILTDKLMDARLSVAELEGDAVLSTAPRDAVLEAARKVRQALRDAHYPMLLGELEAHACAAAPEVPGGVVRALLASFGRELQQGSGADGPEVVAFGSTRAAQVMAHVRTALQPVPVSELEQRFGRGLLPDALIHVGRGLVWVAERVEGFETWQARVTPLCAAVMEREGPERQWTSAELLEALADQAQLPTWLGQWHLASMLRRGGRLRDLGRLRFSLPTVGDGEGRVYLRELTAEALERGGAPLPTHELFRRVRERGGFTEIAMVQVLSHLPIVQVAPDTWGLVGRDVPGGSEAFARALQAIEDALRVRGTGMSRVESVAFVHGLSDKHVGWTPEMVRSLARTSPALRGAANGAIGLAEWDDTRVPTQAEVLRELLDAEGGRARIADVQARLLQLQGSAPTPGQIANLAPSAGGRVRGAWVLDAAVASELPPDLIEVGVGVGDLDGLPRESRPLFALLLREVPRDPALQREEIAGHLRRFERAARDNEFLDLDEARRLAIGCGALLDALTPHSTERTRHIISATVAYFVTPADAESDLEIGGLDDDLRVFNAAVRALGRDDLVLAL